ncbi:MAG: Rrf2 family transcriptional regulator [Myxococcales bacterium]|nr:Rrf2 family transcriptional regulator [Myxococcales bacterium]
MLRLSKKSEYALMAVLHLGRLRSSERAAVTVIAESRNLPRGLLAKVMQDLKRAGMVTSTKGVSGGYQLSRPLSELKFLDVVRPFEENMALVDCLEDHRTPCVRFDCCSIRDPMATLNRWFLAKLAHLTMAEFEGMGVPVGGCAQLTTAPAALQ